MNLDDFLMILWDRLTYRVSDIGLEFLFSPLIEACLKEWALIASFDYKQVLENMNEILPNDQAVSISALKKED